MSTNKQKIRIKTSVNDKFTISSKMEILRIQNLIKQFMRGRGYRYEDLSEAFDISLSTAKRLLAGDDLSFERLLQLCKWLNIEILDLLTMAKIPSVDYDFYSLDQEEYLANHPRHFAVLKLLLREQSLDEICGTYQINLKEIRSILKDLEEASFIERSPQDRIRFLVKPRSDWRVDGPLWETYMKSSAEQYIRNFFKSRADHDADHRHMEFGQRPLTMESFKAFKKEVDDLYKKYVITSELEVQTFKQHKLIDMSCLLLVDQGTLPMLPVLEKRNT